MSSGMRVVRNFFCPDEGSRHAAHAHMSRRLVLCRSFHLGEGSLLMPTAPLAVLPPHAILNVTARPSMSASPSKVFSYLRWNTSKLLAPYSGSGSGSGAAAGAGPGDIIGPLFRLLPSTLLSSFFPGASSPVAAAVLPSLSVWN